jgi:hypothetical protein
MKVASCDGRRRLGKKHEKKVLWTLSSGRIFSKLWQWYISRRKGENKEIGFDSDEVERRDEDVLRAQRVVGRAESTWTQQ